MKSILARLLLAKGAIQRGTVIHAMQNVRNLSCECQTRIQASFIVRHARLVGGERVLFDTIDDEQVSYTIAAEQIIKIDGMDIDRMARSHNLTLDGVDLTSSRRGRRRQYLQSGIMA